MVQAAVIVETALKEYKESFNNDQKKKDRRGDDRSEYKQKKPYGNRDRNSDGTFAATANHDRPKRDTSDITCYACNQKGHYATSCPNKSSSSSSSSHTIRPQRLEVEKEPSE